MTTSPQIDSRFARMWRRLRRPPRGATLMVWCTAIGALLYLASLEGHGFRVAGYVESRSYRVASLSSGRVGTIAVQLQQDVEAGQVLLSLECDETALAVRAATAELKRLRAERARTAAALQDGRADQAITYRTEQRRFTSDCDQARLELLRAQTLLAEDESRLERLDVELTKLTELGAELVAPDRLQDKQLLRDTLATRVQGNRSLVSEHRALLERATLRADEFAATTPTMRDIAIELAPHDEAIAAQQAHIESLRLAERELVLRAPTAGRVAAILRRKGEVIAAGEAVMTVIEHEPSAVVAHLPEEFVQRVTPGTEAVLFRRGSRAAAFEAVVMHTGSEVERLPERADATSATPRWGFAVHLSCPTGRGFVHGEEFTVVFRDSDNAPATPAR